MKTVIKTTITVATMLFISANANALQSDIDAINSAYAQGEAAQLKQLIETTQGYDSAFAQYRLGLHYGLSQQNEKALTSLTSLIATLEAHTNNYPDDAESLALLANVYGYVISLDPSQANSYGPSAFEALERAERLAPNNPRVQLFKGIIAFNTPASDGGSKTTAKKSLTKAVEYFANEVNSEHHWEYSEAHTWLGLTYLELNDKTAALDHLQKAVRIEPDNNWAQHILSRITQ